MNTEQVVERLGLPSECINFDGVLANPRRGAMYIERMVERKLVGRTWQMQVTSEKFLPRVDTINTGMKPICALNFIQDVAIGNQFDDHTYINGDVVSFVKDRKVFTAEVGEQAGKEFWIMGQELTCTPSGIKMTQKSPYMNAERDGSPSEGWVSVDVLEITKIAGRTLRYKKTQVYRKGELEAKFGLTEEQLAANIYLEMDLQKPSEETHLLNVSTDLEVLGDLVFWPNVYFNGRDDNSFDFRKLITPYSSTTPDFIVRIRAYDDSTNEDYPGPNYSGMGNGGKFADIPMENENVKPIRVEFGQASSIETTDDEIIVTFKEGSTRAAVGMAIEYKPLDGKKVANECYYNCLTNKRELSIFAL